MGKKARIKRQRSEFERVDAIGEAYIHALGQLMDGGHLVALFGRPVATGNDASLVLQQEIEARGVNFEDVLCAVKCNHRAEVELEWFRQRSWSAAPPSIHPTSRKL